MEKEVTERGGGAARLVHDLQDGRVDHVVKHRVHVHGAAVTEQGTTQRQQRRFSFVRPDKCGTCRGRVTHESSATRQGGKTGSQAERERKGRALTQTRRRRRGWPCASATFSRCRSRRRRRPPRPTTNRTSRRRRCRGTGRAPRATKSGGCGSNARDQVNRPLTRRGDLAPSLVAGEVATASAGLPARMGTHTQREGVSLHPA